MGVANAGELPLPRVETWTDTGANAAHGHGALSVAPSRRCVVRSGGKRPLCRRLSRVDIACDESMSARRRSRQLLSTIICSRRPDTAEAVGRVPRRGHVAASRGRREGAGVGLSPRAAPQNTLRPRRRPARVGLIAGRVTSVPVAHPLGEVARHVECMESRRACRELAPVAGTSRPSVPAESLRHVRDGWRRVAPWVRSSVGPACRVFPLCLGRESDAPRAAVGVCGRPRETVHGLPVMPLGRPVHYR